MDKTEATRGVSCRVCGCTDARIPFLPGNIRPDEIQPYDFRITDHQYGKHWNLVYCPSCRFVIADPCPDQDFLVRLYQNMEDPEYMKEASGRKTNFIRILRRLEKFLGRKGSLLDVGAASGLMVGTALQRGWEAVGLEPSRSLADAARAKSLPVYCATLEEWGNEEARFDAVTLLDVIEHVAQPDLFLQASVRFLKPGGIVCIVTPDIRSLAARILHSRWWHLRPAHVSFFSRHTLKLLVERLGGNVISVQPYVWHFSVDYLYSRVIKGHKPTFLPSILRKWNIPLNLMDSMELYARWSRL